MVYQKVLHKEVLVTSHTGCVSRNRKEQGLSQEAFVTSHTGCVSRNAMKAVNAFKGIVTSRMGCVSRNLKWIIESALPTSHISHGMCE